MKVFHKKCLLLGFLSLYLSIGASAQDSTTQNRGELSTLSIAFKGKLRSQGALMVALYNRDEVFLKEPTLGKRFPVMELVNQQVFIDSLAIGQQYGIAVFHDLNDNYELDVNLFGYPTEPFAFGNNAQGFFGPPNFNAASVTINATDNVTVITLE